MEAQFRTLGISVVRTYVPMAVGALFSWLTVINLPLPDEARGALEYLLTTALTVAFQMLYYGICRIIEDRWPSAGVLLGIPKAPVLYAKAVPAAELENAHATHEALFSVEVDGPDPLTGSMPIVTAVKDPAVDVEAPENDPRG